MKGKPFMLEALYAILSPFLSPFMPFQKGKGEASILLNAKAFLPLSPSTLDIAPFPSPLKIYLMAYNGFKSLALKALQQGALRLCQNGLLAWLAIAYPMPKRRKYPKGAK
jgi:hypothetical protein